MVAATLVESYAQENFEKTKPQSRSDMYMVWVRLCAGQVIVFNVCLLVE